jgi:DNA-binding transcriptional ArsR family regulator
MRRTLSETEHLTEAFQALGDPIRLQIMSRMVKVPELPCTELEVALPVTKSTISYHIKILYRAGFIDVRKAGRNFFYRARREDIEETFPGLWPRLLSLTVESPNGDMPDAYRVEQSARGH